MTFSSGLAYASDHKADSGAPSLHEESLRTDGQVVVWGLLQTWQTLMDQDEQVQADPASYGDPEADPGFQIPRGRLGFSHILPLGERGARHQLQTDLSVGIESPYDALSEDDTDVQIVDAMGRWVSHTGVGLTQVSFGLQKVPLDRDSLSSSSDLLFQERSVGAAWLAPGRDVGVVAAQSWLLGDAGPHVLLRAGVFNGNGSFTGDTDGGAMSSARLEMVAGDAYRTWSAQRHSALGLGVGAVHDQSNAATSSTLAVDGLLRLRILTLTGQWMRGSIAPGDATVVVPDVLATTVRTSTTAQVSLWLGVDQRQGFELGSRFATFDDAAEFEDNGDVWLLHNGVTWRNALQGLDVGAAYIHRGETYGATVANDTVRLMVQVRPKHAL